MGISTPSNRRGMRRGMIPNDSMETLNLYLAANEGEHQVRSMLPTHARVYDVRSEAPRRTMVL